MDGGMLGETLKQNEMRKAETKLSRRIKGRCGARSYLSFQRAKISL